jgi:DNA-binding transcriptional MerR regulator
MVKTIMTIKQAAKAYSLPTSALRNWCKSGQLQHLKSGNRIYLTSGMIEDFVRGGTR